MMVMSPTVSADEQAERAAAEILAARERANAAAQAAFDAESQLDELDQKLTESEQQLAQMESDVGQLKEGLTDAAVRRFVGAGRDPVLIFTSVEETNDESTAGVYSRSVTGSQLVQADEYEQAIDDLDAARASLTRQRAETEAARQRYVDLMNQATAEVEHLQAVEEQRLADLAVQQALERQRQEMLAREQAAADAAAAAAGQAAAPVAQSAAPPATPAPPVVLAAANPASGDEGSNGDTTTTTAAQQPTTTPEPATPAPAAPAPAAPTTAAPAPQPDPEPAPSGSGMTCPLLSGYAFADTWGAARSGGRSHEGVDMIAASGLPIVAVESGSVRFKTNRLGGNSAWVTGSSGTTYYYAHMSSWEGGNRSVGRGEVIGYVGQTGNAGIPHLHFEVHPGGGSAVNPYPYVRAVC